MAAPTTRHFALQCLAALVQGRWAKWPPETKEQFKATIMALAEEAPGSETFMRERIAALISDVGEKEYPKSWPSLLDDLANCWEKGPAQAVIGKGSLLLVPAVRESGTRRKKASSAPFRVQRLMWSITMWSIMRRADLL
jgi:hypothetical protein